MESDRERNPGIIIAALAVAGAVAGIVAKAADESTISWASDLGTYPAIWVLALAVIARAAPSASTATLRAVAFFAAMAIAYYAWSVFVLGIGGGAFALTWGALSVTAVPIIAAAVSWASRHAGPGPARGLMPGAIIALLAGAALSDGVLLPFWYRFLGELPLDFPYRPVQALVNVGVALVIVGWVPRLGTTRIWALVLLAPMTILGSTVVDVLFSGILG